MNISTVLSCKARHVADSRTIIRTYRNIHPLTLCYMISKHEYNPVNEPILIFLLQLKKELKLETRVRTGRMSRESDRTYFEGNFCHEIQETI